MAGISEVLMLFTGNATGAIAAMKEVGGKLKETQAQSEESGKSWTGSFGKMAALAGGAIAVGVVTAAVAEGVKAAGAYETVHAQLANTARNMNQALDPTKLEETSASMRKLGVTDSETEQSLQKLIQAGMSSSDAMAAQHALNDRAVSDNTTLTAATDEFIAASHGKGKALTNVGIILPTAAAGTKAVMAADQGAAKAQVAYTDAVKLHGEHSKQAEAANAKLTAAVDKQTAAHASQARGMGGANALLDQYSKFAGAGEAKSHTFAGALDGLKAMWDHVEVTIGQKVIPVIEKVSTWVTDHQPQIQAFADATLSALGTIFSDIGDVIQTKVLPVLKFMGDHIDIVKAALITLGVVYVGFKAYQLALFIAEKVGLLTNFVIWVAVHAWKVIVFIATYGLMVIVAVASMILVAAAFLLPVIALALLVYWVIKHWDQIKAFIGDAIKAIVSFVKDHWALMLAILTGPIGLAILWVVNHFQEIKDTIAGVWDDVKKGVAKVWDWITTKIHDAIEGIKKKFTEMKNAAGDALGSIPGVGAIGGVVSHIPGLAGGSDWLHKPMLALIGDNPRGERVQTKDQYDAEQANNQGGATNITVNNPTSTVDVTSAVKSALWLSQMQKRGAGPTAWPADIAVPGSA